MSSRKTSQNLVLLSGIPASGKSSYGRWLSEKKGFLHLDVEAPGVLTNAGLHRAWEEMFQSHTGERFVAALRRQQCPVALDWGFPPCHLPLAKDLHANGVIGWWFDGDRQVARDSFIQRRTVSVKDLDIQMAAIQSNWSVIAATFEPRILNAVRSDGTYLSPDDIYERMFPDEVSAGRAKRQHTR